MGVCLRLQQHHQLQVKLTKPAKPNKFKEGVILRNKQFKKAMALVLCFCIFFPSASFALDSSFKEKEGFAKTEYYMLVEMENMQREELLTAGYDAYTTEAIISVESNLLELSELGTLQLRQKGFTTEQIAILKEYDGGPLSENPQLRAVLSATLSVTAINGVKSPNNITVNFNWAWSERPSILMTDIVAVGWYAVNASQYKIEPEIDTDTSYHMVTYECELGQYPTTRISQPIAVVGTFLGISSKFAMRESTYARIAMSGKFCVGVTSAQAIKTIDFFFSYGHATLSTNPSVSLSTSGSIISFSYNPIFIVSEAIKKLHTVRF